MFWFDGTMYRFKLWQIATMFGKKPSIGGWPAVNWDAVNH